MKKLLAFLLSILMVFSMATILSSCGDSGDSDDKSSSSSEEKDSKKDKKDKDEDEDEDEYEDEDAAEAEAVVKKFAKAETSFRLKDAMQYVLGADELAELFADKLKAAEDLEEIEQIEEATGTKIKSWDDYLKACEDFSKQEAGDFEVSPIEVTDTKKLTKSDLENLLDTELWESLEEYGFETDKIKEGFEFHVSYTVETEESGKESKEDPVYVVKYKGEWKIVMEF